MKLSLSITIGAVLCLLSPSFDARANGNAAQVARTKKANRSEILQFPKFKPVGKLYVINDTEFFNRSVKGNFLTAAQGAVKRPPGAEFAFKLVYDGSTDLSWLQKLKPDDLLSFDAAKLPIASDQFRFLQPLTGLKRLEVDATDISDKELLYIKDFRSLVLLNASHTMIKGDGLVALKNMKELKSLFISHNAMRGSQLAELEGCSSLEYIHLDDDNLSDSELQGLAKVKSLREVLLSHNPKITDAGVLALSKLPNLRWVDLEDCRITRRSFPVFKKMQLKFLRIKSPFISPAEFEELKALLKSGTLSGGKVSALDPQLFAPLR